ncbi:MAG: phosphatidate cytidylyltransferase [Brevefilum sp.]
MLSQRVKAALVFVPLVLILIYIGGWLFNLFILAILLAGAYEYVRLFNLTGQRPSLVIVLTGVALIVLQRWFFPNEVLGLLLSLLILATAIAALIDYERGGQGAALNFALNLTGMLYLGWVGGAFIPLRSMTAGLGWVLTALPSVWLADSGAYFIGKWLGVRKMAPRLSPGKSWAGLAGGALAGTVFGALLVLLWRAVGFLPGETPLWQGALMGLVLSLLTPVGDLLVSLFKRTAGVKDTGNLIPGHGGILDRIDSWIWAALIGYYLVQWYLLL